MTQEPFARYNHMLQDEGSAPIFGMQILQYFSPDGELRFAVGTQGEIHVTQILGLLDLVADQIRKRGTLE